MVVRNSTVQSMHRLELGVTLTCCHAPVAKSGRGPRPLFIIFFLQLGFSQKTLAASPPFRLCFSLHRPRNWFIFASLESLFRVL